MHLALLRLLTIDDVLGKSRRIYAQLGGFLLESGDVGLVAIVRSGLLGFLRLEYRGDLRHDLRSGRTFVSGLGGSSLLLALRNNGLSYFSERICANMFCCRLHCGLGVSGSLSLILGVLYGGLGVSGSLSLCGSSFACTLGGTVTSPAIDSGSDLLSLLRCYLSAFYALSDDCCGIVIGRSASIFAGYFLDEGLGRIGI